MAKPQLAPAARDDIRDIRNYSKAAFGSPKAFDYIEGLRAALLRLGDMPRIGSVERDLGVDIRSASYESHRIYYRCSDRGVLILRILHHAPDARTVMIGPH